MRHKHVKDIKFHTQNHCSWSMLNWTYQFPSFALLGNKDRRTKKNVLSCILLLITSPVSQTKTLIPLLCPFPDSTLLGIDFTCRVRSYKLASLSISILAKVLTPFGLIAPISWPAIQPMIITDVALRSQLRHQSNPVKHNYAVQRVKLLKNESILYFKCKTSNLSSVFKYATMIFNYVFLKDIKYKKETKFTQNLTIYSLMSFLLLL